MATRSADKPDIRYMEYGHECLGKYLFTEPGPFGPRLTIRFLRHSSGLEEFWLDYGAGVRHSELATKLK